jgi:hypothetical protein
MSQNAHCLTNTKTNRLMLLKEMIVVHSENYMKPINSTGKIQYLLMLSY